MIYLRINDSFILKANPKRTPSKADAAIAEALISANRQALPPGRSAASPDGERPGQARLCTEATKAVQDAGYESGRKLRKYVSPGTCKASIMMFTLVCPRHRIRARYASRWHGNHSNPISSTSAQPLYDACLCVVEGYNGIFHLTHCNHCHADDFSWPATEQTL